MYPKNSSKYEMLLNDTESDSSSSTDSDDSSENTPVEKSKMDSLDELQFAAQTVSARIDQYIFIENGDPRTFDFLRSKQKKLMKISEDIQDILDGKLDDNVDVDERINFFTEELYWEITNDDDKKLSEVAEDYLSNCIREALQENINVLIDDESEPEEIDENARIYILEQLQHAAETVVARLDRYIRIENGDTRTFAFLKSKQDKLMRFAKDIQIFIDDLYNDGINVDDVGVDKKIEFFTKALYQEIETGEDKPLSQIADDYLSNCIHEALQENINVVENENNAEETVDESYDYYEENYDYVDLEEENSEQTNIEIIVDNPNTSEKDKVTIVDKYKTLAGLQEMHEGPIVRSLIEHFYWHEHRTISIWFIQDVLERLEAKLSADDLIAGMYELLQKHNLTVTRKELFENIMLGCKVLFDVRKKHAVFSVTHLSFNDLNEEYRRELWTFSRVLKDELWHNKKKAIYHYPPNPYLEKLKIKGNIYKEKPEIKEDLWRDDLRIMEVFGIADCGQVSKKAFKILLSMRANKKVDLIHFEEKQGDHAFLAINPKGTKNGSDGVVVDIWSGDIYAAERLTKKLYDYVHDQAQCLNYVRQYDPNTQTLKSGLCTETLAEINLSLVEELTLNAFERLKQAVKTAGNVLFQKMTECKLTKQQQKTLHDKIDDLSDYVDNIKFVTKEISSECDKFRSEDKKERQILICEFDEKIADFYKKLIAILTVRESSSRFFVDNTVKNLLNVARAHAQKSLLSDPEPAVVEDHIKSQHFSA